MKNSNTYKRLLILSFILASIFTTINIKAQCTHGASWGSSNVPINGNPTTNIGVYAGEYTVFTNIQIGLNYTFSSSAGTDWLVITNGTNVYQTQGNSPVIWTATFSGTVRVHVSTSSACGGQNTGRDITASVIPTSDYRTDWISMDFGSTSWCPGETRQVSVTVRNNGDLPWADGAGEDFNVGVKWNAEPDYLIRVDAQNLAPGATQTFYFNVTAPATLGTDNLRFDVVREACFWFANNGTACGNTAGPGNIVFVSPQLTIQNSITLAPDRIFCASMAVDMIAESCGGTINWYNSLTACQPIASGTDYTTPVLDETTTYYLDVTSPTISSTGSYTSALGNNDFYGRAGQMFDVTAAVGKTVEITGVQVRPDVSGTQTVYIYYRPESHNGFHNNASGAGWILVGQQNINVTANNVSPTITLTTPITVPSGCTYGIYTRLNVRYRGSYTGSESNGDITVHAGWGAADSNTPFVMASGWARGFRGNLHYNVYNVSERISVTAIDDCPTFLPIELLSFDATLNGNHVDLTWTTATERENDYFTIERSVDGLNWEFVAQQAGAGYSSEILNYADNDYMPLPGVSYYRLKQTDYNGEFTYSDIRTINRLSNEVVAYPNPSTGNITISGLQQSDKIFITDLSGKILYENSEEKESLMHYDLSSYADGVYFIKVSGTNEEQILKIVKTK